MFCIKNFNEEKRILHLIKYNRRDESKVHTFNYIINKKKLLQLWMKYVLSIIRWNLIILT